MNKKLFTQLTLATGILFALASCKDDPATSPVPVNPGGNALNDKGVFILNEGNFGMANATVDYLEHSTSALTLDYFTKVNARPLGDVVQSMTFGNNKGYIVLNGSGKVEIVNATTFKSDTAIGGQASPRYILLVDSNKAYVSNWISDNISVIDLHTYAVTTTIPTGTGPEQMVKSGDKVFVSNSGGYGLDNSVTVINCLTDQVITTIEVGDAPVAMKIDVNGKIWVLCRGDYGSWTDPNDDTQGQLVRINPASLAIELRLPIGTAADHPDRMAISADKTELFFLSSYGFGKGVYKFNVNQSALPLQPLVTGNFYGINVNPLDGYLYAADPLDYNQRGYMFRYNTGNGAKVDSFRVGVIPNGLND
jgi:YVTN family beta-propeller protein